MQRGRRWQINRHRPWPVTTAADVLIAETMDLALGIASAGLEPIRTTPFFYITTVRTATNKLLRVAPVNATGIQKGAGGGSIEQIEDYEYSRTNYI